MNKHWVLHLTVLAGLVPLVACGGATDLTVTVTTAAEGEEARGLSQQEIRLLPYNRDSIFEVLSRQAEAPEPQPPQDLLVLRDSVSAARERWQTAETNWNEIRSELQDLSERMRGMSRSSNEYFQAFSHFEDLDAQVGRLEKDQRQAFQQFTALDSLYRARADSFSAVVRAWGDVAFEDYGQIVDSLLERSGREELWDTTGAQGWAELEVPRGNWWIYTRTELVFDELYWNVPYQSRGGADTVVLNRSNAEVRPIF